MVLTIYLFKQYCISYGLVPYTRSGNVCVASLTAHWRRYLVPLASVDQTRKSCPRVVVPGMWIRRILEHNIRTKKRKHGITGIPHIQGQILDT
jgi:hypothetical protein